MITPEWAKSTYSNPSGSCLSARWAKSSQNGVVQVRDTKDPHSPILEFSPAAWAEFIEGIKQ